MSDVALAFLWHMHQPWYPDDVAGENLMPWVRLHGVKSYYGMALHLQEVPEMRCTVNFVPCLVEQIRRYTEHKGTDRFLEVSEIPAADLSEEQALFLLNNFFFANPQHMILPYPRYRELYTRRDMGKLPAEAALRRFQEAELRDLQVWFNLTWIHPLVIEQDADLKELVRKGRYFSESDKQLVLTRHREILSRILPLYRQLAESGQIELTTTPYYHPILPLLLDKRLARETMPEVKLPRFLTPYLEDAQWHVREAIQYHQAVFGSAPRGMWPAEGAVCQSMVPILAAHGIEWMATDEEVLRVSTHGIVSRDPRGYVRNPEQLYQPYWVQEGNARLAVVFRDHALSDLIGFHYQRSDGEEAAQDFLEKVKAIGRAIPDGRPVLVPVILDGENCWEHYPGGGVAFLRALYRGCVSTRGIEPVRMSDFLRDKPPRNTLPRLVAGSWIHANFDIWIGHDEDNTAWDLLHQTREFLRQHQEQGNLPPKFCSVPGVKSTSRKEVTGSGGTDLITAVLKMWFSTFCFASTCKMFICYWARNRRRFWPSEFAAAPFAPSTLSLPRSSKSVWTVAVGLWSGSVPVVTASTKNAARWSWLPQARLPKSISVLLRNCFSCVLTSTLLLPRYCPLTIVSASVSLSQKAMKSKSWTQVHLILKYACFATEKRYRPPGWLSHNSR
jgi:alpha-amylase/alpha-mannosidase (GH57 family)